MSNVSTQIGQSVVAKTSVLSGIQSIDGYTESVDGETSSRFFTREFRYTRNLIHWSDWIEMNQISLSEISVDPTHDVQIQYRYTRSGTDSSGSLTVNWINLQAVGIDRIEGPAFSGSVFSYFATESCEVQEREWCYNVLDKTYHPGIVSRSMTRGSEWIDSEKDRDYIDLWRTISCFFGMHVDYIRRFERFDEDRRLLYRYLTVRGVYLENDQSLQSMIHLMTTYHNQLGRRGTLEIVGNQLVDGEIVNGELLRLINYTGICEEFIFAMNNANTIGWSVDMNSPLNKYIHDNPWVIKLFENGQDLSVVPIVGSTYVSLVDHDGYDDVFEISGVPDASYAGIEVGVDDVEFLTPIDTSIAYELRFWAKGGESLSVSILAFDGEGDENHPLLVRNPSAVGDNNAIDKAVLATTDSWFLVRVIIFPTTESPIIGSGEDVTNLRVGSNMQWRSNTCKAGIRILLDKTVGGRQPPIVDDETIIVPHNSTTKLTMSDIAGGFTDIGGWTMDGITINSITEGHILVDGSAVTLPVSVTNQQIIDGDVEYSSSSTNEALHFVRMYYDVGTQQSQQPTLGSSIYIRDIQFKPLSTSYGKGIVGSPLMTETWMRNSSERSNTQIDEIVRRYLIPHNVAIKNNFLPRKKRVSSQSPIEVIKGLYEERYEHLYQ